MSEYAPYTKYAGSPGVGDMFFRYVFDNQYADEFVRRVVIEPVDDETRGYSCLPENALKAGDRAVLAIAVAARASVVNATDSDWEEQRELTDGLSVPVIQLCGEGT